MEITMGSLFFGLAGIVLLLCALLRNFNALLAVIPAAIGFALALAWVQSLGSVDMGAAFFLISVLIGVPLLTYLIFLLVLQYKKFAAAFSRTSRRVIFGCSALCLILALCLAGAEEIKKWAFDQAIAIHSPQAFIFLQRFGEPEGDNWDMLEKAPEEVRASFLHALAAKEKPQLEWDILKELSSGAERLSLLQEYLDKSEGYVPTELLVYFNDSGRPEEAKLIWESVRDPVEAVLAARRLDLLDKAIALMPAEEAAESMRSELDRFSKVWPEGARAILDRKIRVSVGTKGGANALLEASEPDIIAALIKAGADINAKADPHYGPMGANCYTALHRLLALRNDESAFLLVQSGARLDEPDRCGRTALHYAVAYGGTPKTLALMLEKNSGNTAWLNTQDAIGLTPLHFAAVRGDAELVDMLLKAGALADVPDKTGATPIFYAAQGGGLDVYQALLEDAPEALTPLIHKRNKQGYTAAQLALRQNCLFEDQLKVLYVMGVPPESVGLEVFNMDDYGDAKNYTQAALRVWQNSRQHRADIVRRLLRAGAKGDRILPSGNSILHQPFFVEAVKNGDNGWVSSCTERREDCSWHLFRTKDYEDDWVSLPTSFLKAVSEDYMQEVQYFLQQDSGGENNKGELTSALCSENEVTVIRDACYLVFKEE